MGKTLEQLKEMLDMEQELDIPMKDRFHKTLTEEELNNLTEVKNQTTEDVEEIELDIEYLEAKIAELKKRV
jgi:hypothetical protein